VNKGITRVQAVVVIVVMIVAVVAGAYFATVPRPVVPSNATATPSAVAVSHQDTIIQEVGSQPDSLDPAIDYEWYGAQVIENVYENLLFYKGDKADAVVPWLAQSYTVSPDGMTYTFKLRSGITFTDGTPLDANAVWFSLMRPLIIDDPASAAWSVLQVIRGGQNYSKGYNNAGPSAPQGYGTTYTQAELNDFLNAKPIEVIDPMTVAIHLERPYAAMSFILALQYVVNIVSPTAFRAHWTAPTGGTPYIEGITAGDYHDQQNPWANENMVGTGPYMLKSWDKAFMTVTLVRNEHYWGGPFNRGIAPVPNVIMKGVTDPNTRVLDLKAGTSDILGLPEINSLLLPGGLVYQFADKDTWLTQGNLVPVNPDIQVSPKKGQWPQFETEIMTFNQKIYGSDGKPQAFQPFADVRIRKAFVLAFNRTAYLHDILQNFGVPASQVIPPGMFGYDPSIQPTPYDPTTAKTLLLDAGAHPTSPDNAFSPKNPQTIQISYDLERGTNEAGATMLAAEMNSLSSETGLYVTVLGLQYTQWLTMRRAHRSNLFFGAWWFDYPDPDDFLTPFISRSAGWYPPMTNYNDSAATQLVSEQSRITDPAKRLQVISQIQHMVSDDWAYLFLIYGAAFSLSRSWLHDRPNASLASGIETYNCGLLGLYFAEMEKGSAMSSSGAISPQPSFNPQMAVLQAVASASASIRKGPQTV
jgi:peptide/nickel transport system substrate-binding protein